MRCAWKTIVIKCFVAGKPLSELSNLSWIKFNELTPKTNGQGVIATEKTRLSCFFLYTNYIKLNRNVLHYYCQKNSFILKNTFKNVIFVFCWFVLFVCFFLLFIIFFFYNHNGIKFNEFLQLRDWYFWQTMVSRRKKRENKWKWK